MEPLASKLNIYLYICTCSLHHAEVQGFGALTNTRGLFTYLGVILFITRLDRELEDGVLVIWCSGVVMGPSILTVESWKELVKDAY